MLVALSCSGTWGNRIVDLLSLNLSVVADSLATDLHGDQRCHAGVALAPLMQSGLLHQLVHGILVGIIITLTEEVAQSLLIDLVAVDLVVGSIER